MNSVLKDRWAIVTGAGRGIGRAIALAYAREGANLVLAARTEYELANTASVCGQMGVKAIAVPTDVAKWEEVKRLVEEAYARNNSIDILVNAAGIYGPIGPTTEIDVNAWHRAIEVNLLGPFNLCRALLPHFAEMRRGKIILLGGGGATAPLPNFSSYAASKAGLARFAETIAQELLAYNVQVNVIAPGLVDTSLQDDVLAAGSRAGDLFQKIKQARETGTGAVSPEIAANLAVFLASPASGGLTGKLISAPYDPWREWGEKADVLNGSALFTIRRIDPFTIQPLMKELQQS